MVLHSVVLFFVRKNQTNGHSQRLLTFRRRKDKTRDDIKIFFFFFSLFLSLFVKIIQSAGLSCFVVVSLHCVGIFSSVSLLLFCGGVSLIKGKKTPAFFFVFFLRVFFLATRRRESYPRLLHLYSTSKRSPYAHFHNT